MPIIASVWPERNKTGSPTFSALSFFFYFFLICSREKCDCNDHINHRHSKLSVKRFLLMEINGICVVWKHVLWKNFHEHNTEDGIILGGCVKMKLLQIRVVGKSVWRDVVIARFGHFVRLALFKLIQGRLSIKWSLSLHHQRILYSVTFELYISRLECGLLHQNVFSFFYCASSLI